MTLDELDRNLNRICAGGKFFRVKNALDENVYLLVKELTLTDKLWVDFIYEQALKDGKDRNILPSSELLSLYRTSGIWTVEMDNEIKGLSIVLDELDKNINSAETSKNDAFKMKKIKRVTEEKLEALSRRKAELFATSLERFAEMEKVKAMVFCATYTMDNKKYWPTWNDFENETDNILINSVIDVLAEAMSPVDTKVVRKIARSGGWRVKWQASKNTSNELFGVPLVYLTRNQESLIYWSQVYDAAYEAYERPSDDIIEDDEALDKWFKDQSTKRKQEEVLRGKDGKYNLSNSVSRHGEIGIVAKPGQNIEEIYDLNDPLAKKFLSIQNERIKKAGVIAEQDLRSDKDSRRVIGSKDAVTRKAKGKDGFTRRVVDKVLPGGTLKGKKE